MIWLVVAAAVVLVVAIAVATIGRVSSQLARVPATSVYDLADAVSFVSDRLPDRLAAKLSHDDVEQILRWRLNHLREDGLATTGSVDEVAPAPAAEGGEGPDEDEVRVADEESTIDRVIADADASGSDIDEVDVVVVLDLEARYLATIGAIGPPLDDGP